MTEAVAATPEKSVKRMGWALLALALASPILMSSVGAIGAAKAGELTVYVGFGWLAAAIVIDLLTRKRDAVTKANGRIVAAALALILAGTAVFNDYRDNKKVDTAKKELIEEFMASTVAAKNAPALEPTPVAMAAPPQEQAAAPMVQKVAATSDADKAVAVMGAMKVRAKQFAEESGAIDRKFNSVDLGTVLVAQNLVSKAAIDASRKKLNAYKAAIADRDAMLKKHFMLSEQIIRNSGMSERDINDGLAGLRSNSAITQNYADLTRTQLASVHATEDILNFAQRGLGRITVQDGQPMFQTQADLDEYRRLIQVLTDAAAAEDVVTQRVQVQMQKSKQAMVDQLK